jgi:pyrimidine precursor biosynthesis enzyme
LPSSARFRSTDKLTAHFDLTPVDYTAVRVGMNVMAATIGSTIDAGIGLEDVQVIELEECCKSAGRPVTDVQMLRIDELAELGSCCFCSVLYIVTKPVLARSPKKARAFMRAVHRAAEFLQREPAKARHEYNS